MRTLVAPAVALAALATAAPAAGHVDVLPRTAVQGEPVEVVVRVPTERDVPTTGVEVDFPPEVTVYSLADPPPGWRARPLEAPDGRLRGVAYEGGRIGVGRHADFRMLATPFSPGTAVWRARQVYGDGQVKPWTGEPATPGDPSPETGPTEPGPAAAMEIVPPGAAAAGAAGEDGDHGSGAAVWLGVIAIVISALAALGVGLLWSSRPARLPGGGGDER